MFRLSTKVFVVYRKFRLSTNISFCLQKVPFVYKSFCCLQKVSFVHKHFLLSTKSSCCLQKASFVHKHFLLSTNVPVVYTNFCLPTKSSFGKKSSFCLQKVIFVYKKFLLSTKSSVCLQKAMFVQKKLLCLQNIVQLSSVPHVSPPLRATRCHVKPSFDAPFLGIVITCSVVKKCAESSLDIFTPPPHVTDLPHILTPY